MDWIRVAYIKEPLPSISFIILRRREIFQSARWSTRSS